jgi:hypothetical protein
MFIKTKQVAEMCGVSTFELRRVLRSMPRYDDGVQTHYIWDDVSDAALLDEIKAKVAAYTARGKAAPSKPEPSESEVRAEIERLLDKANAMAAQRNEVAAIVAEVNAVAAETVSLPATLPEAAPSDETPTKRMGKRK